jgi:predicted metal-dependent phosphoesterase TrpH
VPGVIDLHLHTTASDGVCTPSELVDMAWRAGIRTMSVTDHDTVAAVAEISALTRDIGVAFVPGIEITAVHAGRDVHMLGYFIDPDSAPFAEFLLRQRLDRVRRLTEMVDRLADMGKPINRDNVLARKGPGGSLGRPMVARALVKAGHVSDMRQAFDELIGEGKPAYVPRVGPEPSDVVRIIADAGGVASLAHPGLLKRDDLIPALADAGLPALEAFHSDHDAETTEHYLALAGRYGLAVSGGSDYHGEPIRRSTAFGKIGLPQEHFERLSARAGKKGH